MSDTPEEAAAAVRRGRAGYLLCGVSSAAPPPIPAGTWMVDLYGSKQQWLLSTPARDRAEADAHLRRVTARVRLLGAVAVVQHGAEVVAREHLGPDGWQPVGP